MLEADFDLVLEHARHRRSEAPEGSVVPTGLRRRGAGDWDFRKMGKKHMVKGHCVKGRPRD